MGCTNSQHTIEKRERKLDNIFSQLKKTWLHSKRNTKISHKKGFLSRIQQKLSLSSIQHNERFEKETAQECEDLFECVFKELTGIDKLSSFINWTVNDSTAASKIMKLLEKVLKDKRIHSVLTEIAEIVTVSKVFKKEKISSVIDSISKLEKYSQTDEKLHNLIEIVSLVLQRFADRSKLLISQIQEAHSEFSRLISEFLENVSCIVSGPNEKIKLFASMSREVKFVIVPILVLVSSAIIKKTQGKIDSALEVHDKIQMTLLNKDIAVENDDSCDQ